MTRRYPPTRPPGYPPGHPPVDPLNVRAGTDRGDQPHDVIPGQQQFDSPEFLKLMSDA